MYDLYLYSGLRKVSETLKLIPPFSKLPIDEIETNSNGQDSGYLGFVLDKEEANKLIEALRFFRIRGVVLASEYRTPKISVDDAFIIAKHVIEDRRRLKYPLLHLSPVRLLPSYSHPMWWSFGSPIEEWIQQGRAPGMLFANIDKIDGHVWEEADMEGVLD